MAGLTQIHADKVGRNLWVGAVPVYPKEVEENFDAVVLAAKEYQSAIADVQRPGVRVILAPLDDSEPTPEEKAIALKAALEVYDLNKKGKKVLVTCAKGVNRSALIAALAMVLSGVPGEEAIERIRKSRKPASGATPLFNEHFCKLIRDIDGAISPKDSPSH